MSVFSFRKKLPGRVRPEWKQVPRLIESNETPTLVYAIGDIHGLYDRFRRLEDLIFLDAAARDQHALVVILGDFIDRGPHSNLVVERLIAPPPSGITRLCLSGNHEAMMSAFLERPRFDHVWLDYGGVETLCSYGLDANNWKRTHPNAKEIGYQLDALIPNEHMRFVTDRPHMARYGTLVFVHAGIDRTKPLAQQSENDMLWMRAPVDRDSCCPPEKLGGERAGTADSLLVIHGHTPLKEVDVTPCRVNLDTGAFAGGPLSAARLVNGRLDGILAVKD